MSRMTMPDPKTVSEEITQKSILDLEGRIRGLILSNGIPTQSLVDDGSRSDWPAVRPKVRLPPQTKLPSQVTERERKQNEGVNKSQNPIPPHLRTASPHTQEEYLKKHKTTKKDQVVSQQNPRKRMNQSQRRQLGAVSSALLSPTPVLQSPNTIANPSAPNEPNFPAHDTSQRTVTRKTDLPSHNSLAGTSRGLPTHVGEGSFRAPETFHSRLQRPSRAPEIFHSRPQMLPNQPIRSHPLESPSSIRPLPQQQRQLFEPGGYGRAPTQHQRGSRQHHITFASLHAQVDYLNHVADNEVRNAEMRFEDQQAQEALRLRLQQICRRVISEYELSTKKSFDQLSVALECFGSLSSGFATHASDMDLALVSPFSTPDTASADSPIPRLLEKAFLDSGFGARLLTRTRVPIIKFCESPTPELAEALTKERGRWEEGKDKPLKRKRPQKKMNNADGSESTDQNAEASEKAPPAMEVTSRCERDDAKFVNTSSAINTQSAPEDMRNVGTDLNTSDKPIFDSTAIECKDFTEIEPYLPNGAYDDTNSERQVDGQYALSQKPFPDDEVLEDETTERSDEELVRLHQLAISEGWFDEIERKLVSEFVNAVEMPESGDKLANLKLAREGLQSLPDVLSRYREPRDTHLDFPKTGLGIQCDINFSNHLALHNTLMLRCYSHCDPRVRPMVLFVKAWAKRRKINSPYHGTLSSYGYVLMVLHYLVNIAQPPVVPNLQLNWPSSPLGMNPHELSCDGYDVRFWRSEREIRDYAARGLLTFNREPLGSLLRGFFQYFAVQGPSIIGSGFTWTLDVLSLRTLHGLLSKQQKGWTGAKITTVEPSSISQDVKEVKHRYLFAIEDPFEIDHNIARTVNHDGIVAIRNEFRRANRVIQRAGMGDDSTLIDLFEEVQEKAQTHQHTFFGPRFPPKTAPKRTPQTNVNPKLDSNEQGDLLRRRNGTSGGVAVVALAPRSEELVQRELDRLHDAKGMAPVE